MAEDRPTALTLAQAIEEYLDWQALDRGRSPNTVRAYGIDLAGFRAFADAAGIEQLAGVDRDLLREFQVAMARGRRGGRPLSPQTRHRRSSHSGRSCGSARGRNGPRGTSASQSTCRSSPNDSRSRSRPTSSSG
jgi:Phage integrase, N-terminal SAM-like domain